MIQTISARLLLLALAMSFGTATLSQDAGPAFYFGVDLSYVNEMQDCGAVYRVDGVERDPFELLAEQGANLVRARLWHNPDWTAYSTLADVTKTFERAKAAGMATLLDFHYSDNWADPGTQEIPAAWELLDDAELVDAVYDYTTEVLTALAEHDLVPAFVQIGNETNGGILKRGTEQQWSRDADLFNAGIRAVREFAAAGGHDIRILLHVAQPENTDWWFTHAEAAGVTDFDVIGISYYPQWSTFSIADMGAQVSRLKQRFGKDVMVLETAYGWTRDAVDETANNILSQSIPGYPFSPDGQRRFLIDLMQALISNGALGAVYWEPAWVSTECSTRWGQGSHWENATLFDFDNELHEGAAYLSHGYWWPDSVPDGVIDAEYGSRLALDYNGDVSPSVSAGVDFTGLYAYAATDSLAVAIQTYGDLKERDGSVLLYIDTTEDERGADVDPGRRAIVVAPPFRPEFRLDIEMVEERGTRRASYTLNAWIEGDWETVTYTGSAAVTFGTRSIIEMVMPRALLGDPDLINIALVSVGRGRASDVTDALGHDGLAIHDEDYPMNTFFRVPPLE